MFRDPRSKPGVPWGKRKKLLPLLLAMAASASNATDVVVHVTGLGQPLGQVGCSLFSRATGFPMDATAARTQWLPADAQGVTCRFNDVPAGTYAVSIGHDLNGNRRVDTNFIGMPVEQWGVSNNARPFLRAPRFDEAAFQVASDGKDLVIDIEVAK